MENQLEELEKTLSANPQKWQDGQIQELMDWLGSLPEAERAAILERAEGKKQKELFTLCQKAKQQAAVILEKQREFALQLDAAFQEMGVDPAAQEKIKGVVAKSIEVSELRAAAGKPVPTRQKRDSRAGERLTD